MPPTAAGVVRRGPTLRLTLLGVLVSLALGVPVELTAGRVVLGRRGDVGCPPAVPLVHPRQDVLGEVDQRRRPVAVTAMVVDSP